MRSERTRRRLFAAGLTGLASGPIVAGCAAIALIRAVTGCSVNGEYSDRQVTSARIETALRYGSAAGASARAAQGWQRLSETTFGLEFPVAKGEVVVSGTVDADTAGASTPRKAILRLQHRDADGAKQKKFQVVLKIKNGEIKEARKAFPGFALMPGDSVETLLKLKGADLTGVGTIALNTQYRYDFTIAELAEELARGAGALLSGRSGLPIRLGIRVPDGERALLIDHEFAGPISVAAGTFRVGGHYQEERRPGEHRARLPEQVRITVRQLDEAGEQVKELKFRLDVLGTRLAEDQVATSGFDYDAGHRLQVFVTPVGGDIEDDDFVALNFDVF